MKCDMIYMNQSIENAIGFINDSEETIYSFFIGEEIEKPYLDWLKNLNIAKKLLNSILDNKKFKAFLKEEEEYYKEMEDKLNI